MKKTRTDEENARIARLKLAKIPGAGERESERCLQIGSDLISSFPMQNTRLNIGSEQYRAMNW